MDNEQFNIESILLRWRQREAAVLAGIWGGAGVGVLTPAQTRGLTGLEIVRRMIDGQLPVPPLSHHLTFWGIEAEEGQVLFQGRLDHNYMNTVGMIHGGWSTAIMDSAMSSAVQTLLGPERGNVTLDFTPKFTARLYPTLERVRAQARARETGPRVYEASVILFGPDSTVYATAEATFKSLPAGV